MNVTEKQYSAAQRFVETHLNHPAVNPTVRRENEPTSLDTTIRETYESSIKVINAFLTQPASE